MRYYSLSIYLGCLLLITTTCIAADFPYRDRYPELNIVELGALKALYDKGDVLVVDVRSKSEFEAIHIKNAVNLPFASLKFTQELQKLANKNKTLKIAVYDNGNDCIRSYKAAEDALYAMIPNVYVFDAGIDSWLKDFPSDTLLMGVEPSNTSIQQISSHQLKEKMLSYSAFKTMASADNTVVIDARDPIQKVQELPGLENNLDIPLDKLVSNIIKKGHMKEKQLLIFDQVGGQVKWLMYFLEKNQYTNFFFLDGGATSVLKEQEYRSVASIH